MDKWKELFKLTNKNIQIILFVCIVFTLIITGVYFFLENLTTWMSALLGITTLLGLWIGMSSLSFVKYQQEQIAEFEILRQLIFAHSNDGIMIVDSNGKIIIANPTCAEIFKISEELLVGASSYPGQGQWQLTNPDGSLCPLQDYPVYKALNTGASCFRSQYFLRKEGQEGLKLQISAIPYKVQSNEGQVRVLILISDVTGFDNAQRIIEEQQNSLRIASRLTSIGEIASGISNEISNPVGLILARANVMDRDLKKVSNPEIRKFQRGIEQILHAGSRIKTIISSMRAMANQKLEDEFSTANFSDLINQMLDFTMEKCVRNKIKVVTHIPPSMDFDCVPGLFSQVLLQLFVNSMESVEKLEEKWIHLDARIKGELIEFMITDSGHGIPKEIRNRIMLPFFTTKEIGKGTGMGLSLAKSIVESHQGTICLDEYSPNTRFVIEVPRKHKKIIPKQLNSAS